MHQVSPFALALRFRRGIGDRLSRDGRPMRSAVITALFLLKAYTQISRTRGLDAVATRLTSGGGSARVRGE